MPLGPPSAGSPAMELLTATPSTSTPWPSRWSERSGRGVPPPTSRRSCTLCHRGHRHGSPLGPPSRDRTIADTAKRDTAKPGGDDRWAPRDRRDRLPAGTHAVTGRGCPGGRLQAERHHRHPMLPPWAEIPGSASSSLSQAPLMVVSKRSGSRSVTSLIGPQRPAVRVLRLRRKHDVGD